jgi:hypothetical protein
VTQPVTVRRDLPAKKSTAQDAPGSTIVISDDLRVDSRRGRSLGHHADRARRDSNYCALGVSMSLTSSDRTAVSLFGDPKILDGRTLHVQMLDSDASFLSGDVASYLT